MTAKLRIRATILSFLFFAVFLSIWHFYVQAQIGPAVDMDPEYAKLMGATAKGASAMPGPLEVGKAIWNHIVNPFHKDVTLYFGSWNEWSRDPSLPIEEGLPYPTNGAIATAA